jgi:NADPH2:quinone reductase
MPSDNSTVRAARLHEHGEPLVVEPAALPAPGDGEVRVELEFGGVNPIDRYIAEGRVNPDGPLPRTLGGEAAGHLGERPVLVAGEGLGTTRDGLWARAAVVPEAAVVELPDGVSTREAAAMGIAGLTAFECVHELARVTSDDRVLVLGASGGVGSMIVSLARSAGATVWGQTGAQEKAALIVEQGAQQVVITGADGLGEAVSSLEPSVVFDPLGGPFVSPAIELLGARGRLVSFGTSAGAPTSFNMQSLYRKMLSVLGYGGMQLAAEERRPGLAAALDALRDGSLRVRIDSVLALDEVNEAFERLAARRVQGNLVLELG